MASVVIRFILQTTSHSIFKQPHEIYVVGNINELGRWSPKDGIKMTWISEERLDAQIIIPKNMMDTVEYKYVNITSENGQTNWEHGENRLIHAVDSDFVQIQDQYRDYVPTSHTVPEALIELDKLFGLTPEQKINLKVPTSDIVLLRFIVKAGTTHSSHQISIRPNSS